MPEVEGWEIASYFKAAKFVAGDYYDAFTLPDGNLVIVVGDVCGKGVGAALFMTLFRSLLRATSIAGYFLDEEESISPAKRIQQAISITNRYVADTHEQALTFSTIFIGVLDVNDGKLTYINGGNETAYLVHTGGGD